MQKTKRTAKNRNDIIVHQSFWEEMSLRLPDIAGGMSRRLGPAASAKTGAELGNMLGTIIERAGIANFYVKHQSMT